MTTDTVRPGAIEDPPPLHRNRDFTLLWGGQTISQLGSAVSVLAFPLLVLSIHGSAIQAGALGTLQAVIRVAFQLPAGAFADRWNRKRLMQICDAGRAGLLAIITAAILLDRASLVAIFGIAGATAVLDVLFSAAEMSIVSQLIPRSQVSDAYAKNEARSYGATLTGPPLAGFLYAAGRSVPFLFNALSFLVSLLAVSCIRKPSNPTGEKVGRTSLRQDMSEGLRHVAGSPFLRAAVLMAAPVNFAITGAQFATILILTEAGHSSRALGVAQGCIAIGGLVGALCAGRIQKLLPFQRLLLVGLSMMLVLIVASTALAGQLVMVIPLAMGLFLAPAVNSALFGRIASTTPNQIQGRVISVVVLSATAAASLAPITVGSVVEHIGRTAAMSIIIVATTLSVLAAVLGRRVLSSPRPAPVCGTTSNAGS